MSYQPPNQPAPVQAIAYESRGPQTQDLDHLKLLAIFHYVWGGLVMFMSLFAGIYIFLGVMFMNMPAPARPAGGPPPPDMRFMGVFFIIFGAIGFVLGMLIGALNLYSARSMQLQKRRTLSLVMAGIDCMSIPLGTALGVFTFIILLRKSVEELYRANR